MRKNNCELIRQELDELMLDEVSSSAVVQHLRECAGCREFQEQQTKLRRMVGGLGIVSAPPDFDFRLRARLANESTNMPSTFMLYWPLTRRGLQVVGLALVIVIGVSLTRNALNQTETTDNLAKQAGAEVQPPPKPIQNVTPVAPPSPPVEISVASDNGSTKRKNERTGNLSKTKRPLATLDFASQRAEVIGAVEPVGASAAFPIDASQQSFTVSFDDGRGNARTISVPTISFGSQRIVQNANQFAPKRVW